MNRIIEILDYLIKSDCNYVAAHNKFSLTYKELSPLLDIYKAMGIDGLVLAKEYVIDRAEVLKRLKIQLDEIEARLEIEPENKELKVLRSQKLHKLAQIKKIDELQSYRK